MADAYFRLTNTVAFAAWIVLLLLPGQRRVSGWLCAWVVPALLAASYAAIIATKLLLGGGEQSGDIMTMDGLRQAFADDWVFAAAWTHYLVFDMVVGAGIARDAVRRG
ncbi:MAG: abscisic acid-deficient protein Aba4 family protein, partial [Planctomycetaceae bacterium]